ncbi:hypothetical protein P43SY_002050 [Pythium insidiosum]|uniref:Globin domain-containing protein n=1 Tax=Pythium insidiosum TaxID=114742 RepID=A0AAD5M5E3_PYTIN|nr:hypothetical protein P43SY_002050 [Pythium insidiosum]
MGAALCIGMRDVAPGETKLFTRTPSLRYQRFSTAEQEIICTYLPSFQFLERSSEADRRIIENHWQEVFKAPTAGTGAAAKQSNKVVELYDTFFKSIEERSPHILPVFRSSMHVRGRALLHIPAGVRSLLVSPNFATDLARFSATHRRFGVKPEHFDPLGISLIDAIRHVSGENWGDSVEQAWQRLYAHTSVVLIVAQQKYDAKHNKKSKMSTRSHASSTKRSSLSAIPTAVMPFEAPEEEPRSASTPVVTSTRALIKSLKPAR